MASEESNYMMASEEETSRLSNQHEVIKDAMGGLVLAPIDLTARPLRILDSATADGTWVRDLRSSTTQTHDIVGTDIDSRPFPANPGPNTSYQVQDINQPWPDEWRNSFDIVHQRLALVGANPLGKALDALLAMVKPGGWIQLIEAENTFDTADGPAMYDFMQVMKDIFTTMGVSLTLARSLPEQLRDAGFEDVHERVVDCLMGARNADAQLAQKGAYSTGVAAKGLAKVGKTLPASALTPPLTANRLDRLAADLKEELIKQGGNYPLRVVWGRKPL